MQKKSATDAAKNFGECLDQAQHDPLIIEKRGRPIAVLYSYEDSRTVEALRLEALQNKIAEAEAQRHTENFETFDHATLDETRRACRRRRLNGQ